ncbi:MAG TPA: PHP domain-containing protein [Mycobacteriales bacterium]|nr:PHP domain-containing protein [Mycobacteriales bacterium]
MKVAKGGAARDPLTDLQRIAYLLERAHEATPRVKAFRTAASIVEELPAAELAERAANNTLTDLAGIGDTTSTVIRESLAGKVPAYLAKLEAALPPVKNPGRMQAALKGDLHMHSDWSDGGSPIEEMVTAARDLGHEYVALTDHSPRLTVARGLTADRLREQLKIVKQLNKKMAPFRILTGIEVDILEDGSLDQDEELLAELDVVVASVHSKLRMDARQMTERMVVAVANPHTDILGHCTGRLLAGRGRPESEFDADLVFEACKQFGTAVEINSRPERLDPPRRLLALAEEIGCMFSVDTDAHAPGQLEWQVNGCERADEIDLDPDRVINTRSADDLLELLST